MSVESIKKLVQCESEAKERLERARREQSEVRAKAKDDARLMVEGLRRENEEKLAQLEKEVEEYIRVVGEKLRADMEMKIKGLKDIRNRREVVDVLVRHVCDTNQ